MQIKMFEIRDHATFIPVMTIKIEHDNDEQRYLLERAGVPISPKLHRNYILLIKMAGNGYYTELDPFSWQPPFVRTMRIAHKYIKDHWSTLKEGDVIDVQHIVGETEECKVSERYG